MLSEARRQTLQLLIASPQCLSQHRCPVNLDQNFKVYSADGPTLHYSLSVVRVSRADKKELSCIFFPSQTVSEVWHFRESWPSPWKGEEHTLAESYCVPAPVLELTKYISHGSGGWESRTQSTRMVKSLERGVVSVWRECWS